MIVFFFFLKLEPILVVELFSWCSDLECFKSIVIMVGLTSQLIQIMSEVIFCLLNSCVDLI